MPEINPQNLWTDIQAIRAKAPLVHNITNYVVMEQTANSLLALGASPVMAHAPEEVEDMTRIAHSLVLNIGTLSTPWINSMKLALKTANSKGIPIVFDPVGAGATPFRTTTAHALLKHGIITVIRGNAAEITALNGYHSVTKGVDSPLETSEYIEQAKALAEEKQCLVWMSGQTDVITNGKTTFLIHNGHVLMGKVTGMGCTATALTGAFLAINPNPFLACVHAALLMSIAGEIAAENKNSPGSFKTAFIDTLYNISLKSIEERIRIELR